MTVATGLRLVRPESLDEIAAAPGAVLIAGGTEVVPQLRDGLLEADTLVDISGLVPRGIVGTRIGAGTTLAEIEASSDVPEALREACRLASSPQLRNMGTIGGNLLQSTRCLYWRLAYPCRLHGGDTCQARDGRAARERDLRERLLRLVASVGPRGGARRARGDAPHEPARAPGRGASTACPTAGDRRVTTLEPGEVLLELEVPAADRSVYLKAMDRKRFSFPLVGVAAVRRGEATTVALSGVAPIPWLLDGSLDAATPLPGNAYKLEIAKALVSRALATIDAG